MLTETKLILRGRDPKSVFSEAAPYDNKFSDIIDLRDLSSGYLKTQAAKDAVSNLIRGKGRTSTTSGVYRVQGRMNPLHLRAGQIVLAHYNEFNQGADLVRILGFTGDEKAYGKGGIKFKSVDELLRYYKVSDLKSLEKLQDQNEYGYHSYIVAQDLETGDKGPWYYLYRGRWSRGSGAEKLSFVLMKKD